MSDFLKLSQLYLAQQRLDAYDTAKNKRTDEQKELADINNDGKIDSKDKKEIQKQIKELEKDNNLLDFDKDDDVDIDDLNLLDNDFDLDNDGQISDSEKQFLASQRKEINKKIAKNNKKLTGYSSDGKYYNKGKLATGVFEGKYFVKGELAKGTQLYKKILYVDGEKATETQIYKNILYVKGEKSKDTVVFNDTLFIKGKKAGGTKLYNDVLYKNGVKATGTEVYKNKLYVNGEIENNTTVFKNKTYKDGVLLNGFSDLDNKFYNKGKLYSGRKNDVVYKKGLAYTDKSKKTLLTGKGNDNNYYQDGLILNGENNNLLYQMGQLYTGKNDNGLYFQGNEISNISDIQTKYDDNGQLSEISCKFGNISFSCTKDEILSFINLQERQSGSLYTQKLFQDFETADISEALIPDILIAKFARTVADEAYNNKLKSYLLKSISDKYIELYNEIIKSQIIKTPDNMENETGEVVEKDDGLYVNDGTQLVKLNMTSEQYLDLFPPIQRYSTKQGSIGDCYFVSSILSNGMKNPKTFAQLLEMINIDKDNNVSVNFKGDLSEYPVTFTNGELFVVDFMVDDQSSIHENKQKLNCKGSLYLEQAFAVAKFLQGSTTEISSVDIDAAFDSIWGGCENQAINDVFQSNLAENYLYRWDINALNSQKAQYSKTVEKYEAALVNLNNISDESMKNIENAFMNKVNATAELNNYKTTILNDINPDLNAQNIFMIYDIYQAAVLTSKIGTTGHDNIWKECMIDGKADIEKFKSIINELNTIYPDKYKTYTDYINSIPDSELIQVIEKLNNTFDKYSLLKKQSNNASNQYSNQLTSDTTIINSVLLSIDYNHAISGIKELGLKNYLINACTKNIDEYNNRLTELSARQENLSDYLYKYAEGVNSEEIILGASSARDDDKYYVINSHAYTVEYIDTENQTVKILNPWNCGVTITIPFSEFEKDFQGLYLADLSKLS